MNVFVGMSGGVDSSVAAMLLRDAGHKITGVYMKNWTRDLPGMRCPWAEDLADAKRVAVKLGIPLLVFDFQKEYKRLVVDYMINEFKAGRTPNPDVMCNQEVKFKLFLDTALERGADAIATGHYATIVRGDETTADIVSLSAELTDAQTSSTTENTSAVVSRLAVPADASKDQTYFLYRISSRALGKTLFPLGNLKKTEVRALAKKRGLITAGKKDSVGICFVGQVGIKEFLSQFVDTAAGDIVDKASGTTIGQHDGALFYTIGQRHGLSVGGGLPYYVSGKDMASNTVYVTRNLNDPQLMRDQFEITDTHFINQPPSGGQKLTVRIRHLAALLPAIVSCNGKITSIKLAQPERAITPGQSAVIYDGDEVLGGAPYRTVWGGGVIS